MISWPELPKISILLEVLTNDDMQNGASNLLQFLLKYKEIVGTRSKSWFFESFWEGFFVYSLLHPMSYTPTFWKMKDLLKICICGKFYQYSICVCEVNNFQGFSYWFSSHEWGGGGKGVVLTPPNIRPDREWRAIACTHARARHILFSCAIISRLNFV